MVYRNFIIKNNSIGEKFGKYYCHNLYCSLIHYKKTMYEGFF